MEKKKDKHIKVKVDVWKKIKNISTELETTISGAVRFLVSFYEKNKEDK